MTDKKIRPTHMQRNGNIFGRDLTLPPDFSILKRRTKLIPLGKEDKYITDENKIWIDDELIEINKKKEYQ